MEIDIAYQELIKYRKNYQEERSKVKNNCKDFKIH